MRRSPLTRWLVLCVPLVFTACATIQAPEPPSLDLPKPPSDLRATRKGDRVTLTWTTPTITTDRQAVRSLGPTSICRGIAILKECGQPVAQSSPQPGPPPAKSSKQKPQSSYYDELPAQIESDSPAAFVNYAVEVLNRDGRGAGISNQVKVSLAHTMSPPGDFQARVTGQGIILSWAGNSFPQHPGIHYVYRVYRRTEGSADRVLAGELPAGEERSFSLTDSNIEWEKTYVYGAETVTVISEASKPEIQVEGDDTPTIQVFADDVFPPAVPTGLQAVFSGPGQQPFIDLVWAPVADADLAGYNIYRQEDSASPAKINSVLVRAPAYRDSTVQSGKHYSYSISAVDLRGNESARSDSATEDVP